MPPLRYMKIILALLIGLLCLGALTYAEEPQVYTKSGYRYIVTENNTVIITGYENTTTRSLHIPETLDGKKVTGIGDRAFEDFLYLEEFKIPIYVTEIGVNPFVDCSRLTEIIVPDNHPTLEMKDGMLIDRTSNRIIIYRTKEPSVNVTIPDGIETIGDYAFYSCGIESVTIPEGVTEIGDSAFESCSRLVWPNLPASLEKIGNSAFRKCYNLGDEIQIPGTVKTIGEFAFHLCDMISVTVSEGTEEIGNNAFHGCTHLTDVYLPDSLGIIGNNPFAYCFKLQNIHISDNHPLLMLDHQVLYDRQNHVLVCYPKTMKDDPYEVLAGTRKIGGYAFAECSVRTVILPDGLEIIGDGAFYNGWLRGKIVIPSTVTEIGICAYSVNQSISTIVLPSSITYIGESAFALCDPITAIVEPDSYAKQYCIENEIPYEYPEE